MASNLQDEMAKPLKRRRMAGLVVVLCALGIGSGFGVQRLLADTVSTQGVDDKGRAFDAPAGMEVSNGRVPVASRGETVGWADAHEVFGPPAAALDEVPPSDTGLPEVYESPTSDAIVGHLGPSGFIGTGDRGIEQQPTVTTIVSG